MMAVSSYEVVPGKSIGLFTLGDTLWDVLELLRTQKTQYPKVDVSWDTGSPRASAVVIHLPHLTLYFPYSPTQALTQITIPHITQSRLSLTYETHILSSPTQTLTRGTIGRVLGPTYDAKSKEQLVYPGLSFTLAAGGGARDDRVENLTVSVKEGIEVALKGLRSCVVLPGRGVILHLPDPVEVIIGHATSQDLLLLLGPPIRKFWKEDNRMARMWGGASPRDGEPEQTAQCFWNYFQHGLDFLVSASGAIVKVIAYSNIPGTPLFQRYARCPWIIQSSSGDLNLSTPVSIFTTALTGELSPSASTSIPSVALTEEMQTPSHLEVPKPGNGGKKSKKRTGSNSSNQSEGSEGSKRDRSSEDKAITTPDSTSGGGGGGRSPRGGGVILDRIGEGGLDGVQGEMISRLVGFPGLVIEEDLASGGICSVLVYGSE